MIEFNAAPFVACVRLRVVDIEKRYRGYEKPPLPLPRTDFDKNDQSARNV